MNSQVSSSTAIGPVEPLVDTGRAPHGNNSMNTPQIAINNVHKSFQSHSGRILALEGVSLDAPRHRVTTIIGPSGCGKSTILKLVAGFEKVDTGRVLFNDTPVTDVAPDRMMVFQQPVLFPWMTVQDNARFGANARGADKAAVVQGADAMLEEVNLTGFEKHYPYQLSGGMRQRLQLARSFSLHPEVLLLDEPFGALDAQTRLKMQELLARLVDHHKPTVLLITHDYDEALFCSDRVYVMSPRPGRIVDQIDLAWGWPRNIELLDDPEFVALRTRLIKALYRED